MAGRNELDPFGLGLWKIWILQLAASGLPAVHTLSELGELGGPESTLHYTIMSLPKQGPRVGFCIVFATHSELWFTTRSQVGT